MSIKEKYTVRSIDTNQTKEWFLYKHYAHRIPNSVYTIGLYEGNVLQGVVSFGMTANNNLNDFIEGYPSLELNRLVINDGHEKNLLSFFVSSAIKLLPSPLVIISYADSGHGHHGYIYQATNWIYTGMGKGDYEFIKDGRQYHRKNLFDKYGTGSLDVARSNGYEVIEVAPKHRYIFLLGDKRQVVDMRKKLPFKIEPYPKGDNQRYDASYKPTIQTSLF